MGRFSRSILSALAILTAFGLTSALAPSIARAGRTPSFEELLRESGNTLGGQVVSGQEELIRAIQEGRGLNFVEVRGAVVSRLLADDNEGRRHQKWEFELSDGSQVLAIYNTDICDRVPLKVGDVINLGGQYIWDRGGGILHWLHEDPMGRRPHGYVDVNGVRYGEVVRSNRGGNLQPRRPRN